MSTESKIAIVFPGQGSQSLGMMNGLLEIQPDIKKLFNSASEILSYDLLDVITSGPEEKLNQTEITQPALLTTAYAAWLILKEQSDLMPSALAGHSLGEYTALLCAGVISFEDAVALVAERGRCMQKAVPAGVGAMAAILGMDDDQVIQVCADVTAENEIVSAANFNSPGQIVIAGNKQAVERAIDAAKEAGAKRAMLLPVSVPSHCMLMKEAANEFEQSLNKVIFNDAEIPVLQNVDAKTKSSSDEIKAALLEQLYKPVLWVDCINNMKNMNITKIIECGPGKVLSGLIKRIDRSFELFSIQDEDSLKKVLDNC